MQLVDVLVNVGPEFNQVEDEQETEVNVHKHLKQSKLWLIVEVANVHINNSAHQEHKEIVEYSMMTCSEFLVKNAVPLVILYLETVWHEEVS